MSAIVLSDIHLRDSESVKSRVLIRFLQEHASKFDRIYILGDLFDVWPGTTPFLLKNYSKVMDAIKSLVQDGHEVKYIEGNHDFKLGEHFKTHLGVEVYTDRLEEYWDGKRVFMMHGDLGNPKEVGYRVLRKVLRADALHTLMRFVPGEWVFQVGLKSSQFSRKYQSAVPLKSEAAIRQIYRKTAEEIFAKGYDLVFMGHTHLPDDVTTTVSGRKCRYINTGDWVRHFTYVEYDGENLVTKTHPLTDS